MQRSFVVAGLTATLIVFLVASCAHRPDLVGQWQQVDGADTLSFGEDGTFTAVDNTGATAVGRYTLHADGTLYYAVTHTDVMQTHLRPVEDLAVNIVGVQFHRDKAEITIMAGEAAPPEAYRRIEPPAKTFR